MKNERVVIRMSDAARDSALLAAETVGLNLSTWLRMRALEQATGVGKSRAINDGAGDGPAVTVNFTLEQSSKVRAAAKTLKISVGEFIRRAAAK